MAYYLGYKNNSEYITIDLANKCGEDILEIIKYTCGFMNIDELKDELYNEGLIPYRNTELAYLIEKGQKGNKSYVQVPNIERIYFFPSRSSFNINHIKQYLLNNSDNKDLFTILYASYLKKIGVLDDIKNYLNSLLSRPGTLKITINELASILKSSSISSIIKCILSSTDQESNSRQVDLLIRELSMSNSLLCSTFNYLKRRLNTPRSHIIESLKNITTLQSKEYPDEQSIIRAINEYINLLTSPSNRETDNGDASRVQTREIVDVGVIIQNYKEYCWAIEAEKYQEEMYESNLDDDSYLEEEDFAREGTTSSDSGFRLRISDSMKWSGTNNGY